MRKGLKRVAVAVLPLLLLAGCTERAFLEGIGAGKGNGPDPTLVPQGQQLIMPPDLNLPAPKEADLESRAADAATAPAPAAPAAPATQVSTTPSIGDTIVPGTNMTFQQQQDALYAKYGIAKLKPDGTPKTHDALQEELRQAVVAEKRRANPNYGTIWNLGELFSD